MFQQVRRQWRYPSDVPGVAQIGGNNMAAKAGEKAREGGEFRCEKCHHMVRVNKGAKIPRCPNCGNPTFDTREHETSGAGAAR